MVNELLSLETLVMVWVTFNQIKIIKLNMIYMHKNQSHIPSPCLFILLLCKKHLVRTLSIHTTHRSTGWAESIVFLCS